MTTIRLAAPEDVEQLSAFKLATFRSTFLGEGFAIPYPPADLAAFELASYAPPVIAAELADPARRTWVATHDGAFAGYAQVGPCKLPHPDVRANDGELYQLYVGRAHQGTGLGARLFDQALDHLANVRPGPVWLGVWSGNLKAQQFYARRGFERVGGYGFPVGSWTDDELILRRE